MMQLYEPDHKSISKLNLHSYIRQYSEQLGSYHIH